ncbi:MAG: hypothetical protein M3Z75_28635 [Actinomycetota bacterium]|nr:hypothetical protein [Actinomycetota bacterium]
MAGSIGRLLSGPSPIGAAIQSRSQGHGPVREKPAGTGTNGGTWYAMNGPDLWALGPVDPRLACREYTDNTRAAYAHAYPDNWFGVLSAGTARAAGSGVPTARDWRRRNRSCASRGPAVYLLCTRH